MRYQVYLFLSTATTGFDNINDDIIKLSYIIEDGGNELVNRTFHIKPRRGRLPSSISEEALNINGIDIKILRTYGNPEDACYSLIGDLKEATKLSKDKLIVVGHNIKFDLDFINNFVRLYTDYNIYNYIKFGGYDLMYIAPLIENVLEDWYSNYKFITLCVKHSLDYINTDISSKTYSIKKLFDIYNNIVRQGRQG